MRKHAFLWPIAVPLLFLGACGPNPGTIVVTEPDIADERKPNLVIFYIDNLGYGDVGSYGAAGRMG